MTRIKLAIAGLGKIALDQHVPTVARSASFELVAVADPRAMLPSVANYRDLESLLRAEPDVRAIAICTPPQVRMKLAQLALDRGCHVLLEKPPGTAASAIDLVRRDALRRQLTLVASWHSRYAAGVELARTWLKARAIRSVRIHWLEDVQVWHPGQDWIWQDGGFGVFDPGINALSILTHLLPERIVLREARLDIPANLPMPIAATLQLTGQTGTEIQARFDFRHSGEPRWDIHMETADGQLDLSRGGADLAINGESVSVGENREYDGLYQHFASLIQRGASDVDLRPLLLVEAALVSTIRHSVPPFD